MSSREPLIFKEFIHLFGLHQERNWKHPWEDSYRLTQEEREAVISSIQQFQLGEGSDGSRFLKRAERFAKRFGVLSYVTAVQLFIAEENRHSKLLAQFLAKEGIPPLKSHWVDWCFRLTRRLAGAETMATTLVTAEIIARPYYRALRGATASKLLKSICTQILAEEDTHIRFQAASIACMRLHQSRVERGKNTLFHRGLLEVALAVVWHEHRSVFSAGNYTFAELRAESLNGLGELNSLILQYSTELEQRLEFQSGLQEIKIVGRLLHGK